MRSRKFGSVREQIYAQEREVRTMTEELKRLKGIWRSPCYTDGDFLIAVDIREKMPDIPDAEPVRFAGICNGIRNTTVQASVYDAMMAELHGDKARRAEKFRKTHDRCKKSKDKTPADRRKDKINRMHRMYGLMFEDGKNWYWEYCPEGRKQTTDPDADIVINRKIAEMEKAAYAELLPDREHIVGTTTLTSMIHRLWKQMVILRKPYEDKGYDCFEHFYYDRDGVYRYMRYYCDRYYTVQNDYDVLCTLRNILRARKMHEVTEYDSEEDENYFVEVGMRRFHDLLAEMNPQPRYIDDGWRNWRDYQDELDAQYWKDLAHLDDYIAEERGDYFLTEEEEDDLYE